MSSSPPRNIDRSARLLVARLALVSSVGALGIGIAAPARSANPACYEARDRVCPVADAFDRCFGDPNVVTPRPTVVGTLACDALNDGALVLDQLGKGLDATVKAASRDMQRAADVVMKGAVNREAAATFVEARASLGAVVDDVHTFTKDAQCGVHGSLENVGDGLEQVAGHLVAAGELAPRVGAAASQGLRASVEVAGGLAEVGALGADLAGASEGARAELARVKAALDAAVASLAELDRANAGKAFESGLAVASTVGPFVVDSAVCANLLVSAIANAAAALGSGSAGVASCPETAAAGCAVGVPVSAITGVASALSGALGAAPCKSATDNVGKLGEHIRTIERFVDASVTVAESLGRTADALNDAGSALSRLAAQAPKSAEARIGRAKLALGRAAAAVDGGVGTLRDEVAPRMSRLAAKMMQQMSDSVVLLSTCWNRASALAAETGKDTADAVALLASASTRLIDAGRVYQNLVSQSSKALDATTKEATARYKAVDRSYGEVHRELWGVSRGKTDLPRTATHLTSLVTNPPRLRELAKDVGTLADRSRALVQASVQAGNDAFLDRDRLSKQARDGFDAAEAASRKAKLQLAKARAAAQRIEQASKPPARIDVRLRSFDAALVSKQLGTSTRSPLKK